MKTLCIVPCGSRKIWDSHPNAGPTPAKNVYTGPFSKKCQEYAITFYPESWCILSAKYGFLWPDELIPGKYNVTFNKPSTNPISIPVLRKDAAKKLLMDYERIIVLGGSRYVEMCRQVFTGCDIHNPLEGCKRNGEMMHIMKEAILKKEEIR